MDTIESTLQRFELAERVGAGGMGDVYRARDRLTGEAAAVKVLRHRDHEAVRRFRHEAELLASIRAPGIVRYLDHGVDAEGREYLAMEWLEGTELRERLRAGPMEIGEAVRLARAVALALRAVHEAGVVHRDIKPSNLLLPPSGDVEGVKLIDLGIARTLASDLQLTKPGAIIGTLAYMAPEQASASRGAVDHRADLFSLGCVLFECVTGRPPFEADSSVGMLAKILFEEPPSAASLRPSVTPALDSLLLGLLAKEPEARFPTAGLLVDALDAVAAGVGAPRPQSGTLSVAERRVVCVVIGRPAGAGRASPITLPGDPLPPDRTTLGGVAKEQALRAEVMADGSVVCVVSGTGGPVAHSERAVSYAYTLLTRVPGLRLAVTTGRATTGSRLPLGDALDRASLLLRDAPVGEAEGRLRLDAVTARLIGARYEVGADERGAFVRGRREEVGPDRQLLGRPTPFLGRRRELRSLEGFYEDCAEEGLCHRVLVVGPAGIGKSRLRDELVRRLRREEPRPRVWMARCDELGASSAFGLIASLLRVASRVAASESRVRQRRKLTHYLARYLEGEGLELAQLFFGELLGLSAAAQEDRRLLAARDSPEAMTRRLGAAIHGWLSAVAARRPLVLILEDLHWCDPSSLTALGAALRRAREGALLLVAFARPEVEEARLDLSALAPLHELRLAPLSPRASAKLIESALGEGIDEEAAATIAEQAEGNPFFLEELIRAFREGRDLRVGTDALVAILQSRLEGFGERERRVLRAASVFGTRSWVEGVERLLGEEGVFEDVLALVDAELLSLASSSRFEGQTEIVFRHALLREAAYVMLTAEDRRLGHRLAARWLEEAGETDPARLAEHSERGIFLREDAERAAEQWGLAAARASSFVETIERLERAIALLRAPEGEEEEEPSRIELELRLTRDHALVRSGRGDRLLEVGEETLAQARALEDHEGVIATLTNLAVSHMKVGHGEEAERRVREAEAAYAARPSRVAKVHLQRTLMFLCLHKRDLRGALGHAKQSAEAAERLGVPWMHALMTHNVGNTLVCLGEHEEAYAWIRRSQEISEEGDFRTIGGENERLLGFLRVYHRGEPEGREEVLRSLERAASHGDAWSEMHSIYSLALIDQRLGDREGALEGLERLRAMATERKLGEWEAIVREAEEAIREGREPPVRV